jgi:hypothetical protein
VTSSGAKQFCLNGADGKSYIFEAGSSVDKEDWIFELNAVLFAKGADGSEFEIATNM